MTGSKGIARNLVFSAISTLLLSACTHRSATLTDYNHAVWPRVVAPSVGETDIERSIDALLARMSLEEKVGQMTQAEITWAGPEDVHKYHLGSLLNGGGSFLHGKRAASVAEWLAFMDDIYDASMDTSDGKQAIPITYGIDAVHGNNKFGQATIFPHNIGLGATRNRALLRRIGEITALEVLVTGIDWTFAPTLAVARDDRWGRTYESYSEDPQLVARLGAAMVEGLQGEAHDAHFLGVDKVYASAKHWLGDGGTLGGRDQGDTRLSEAELRDLQASAYFPALASGVQSVMASHNSWLGDKLHGHHYLLQTVLKDRLGFDGFVVGDWNAHGNVPGCRADSCAQAINAGIDLFMVVEDYPAFIANTLADVRAGRVAESRIDDAVRRILRVKFRSGLFDKGRPSERALSAKTELMGSAEHRAVAAQAVRESLVLLKNNGQLLPLSRKTKVLVAGDGADNLAKQCGGWTISWQGNDVQNHELPGATSILDGIREQVEAAGGQVQHASDGRYTVKPDVAIVVYGEEPYAEWYGDIPSLDYSPGDERDAQLLEKLKAEGIPVVSVFLSGRPLWVNRELNASDAFVAAWLPGSEGAAVADLLFRQTDGRVNADFTGRLSFSWPGQPSQTPLNLGDRDYEPLFAYGFGLSVHRRNELGVLDTSMSATQTEAGHASYSILDGRVQKPWQVFVAPERKPAVYLDQNRYEDEHLAVMEADRFMQGDAQEFRWKGHSTSAIGFGVKGRAIDLSKWDASTDVLQFTVRTIETPSETLFIDMACETGLCGKIALNAHLPPAAAESWRDIAISLSCFTQMGSDLRHSTAPFVLSTGGPAALRLSGVHIRHANRDPADITCAEGGQAFIHGGEAQ